MAASYDFSFIPDRWTPLREEAQAAASAPNADTRRWRAYRALELVLDVIEQTEWGTVQAEPLHERLTNEQLGAWLRSHPAAVKMWMHRIRQAGRVDTIAEPSPSGPTDEVLDALHKLLRWLVEVYDTVPPTLELEALDTDPAASASVSEPVQHWLRVLKSSTARPETIEAATAHLLHHIADANHAFLQRLSRASTERSTGSV